MSKYHLGDKFIVEVKEVLESNNGTLYRSNFSTLVFDDYGLDKLQKYDEIGHRLELIDELKQAEYNRGLADAWELAFKIAKMNMTEITKIFDCGYSAISSLFTAEEALAKIEAYEKEKSEIKVGDVIKYDNNLCVVVSVFNSTLNAMFADGGTINAFISQCKKTGKHIDIESLLRQIGE